MKLALPFSIIVLSIALVGSVLLFNAQQAESSVWRGQEYSASQVVNATAGTSTLKATYGSIGSIVVENTSSAASLVLYDTASTTIATSSATQLLSFDVTAGEGTYQYDVEFKSGLMLDVGAAFDGDVVITYR